MTVRKVTKLIPSWKRRGMWEDIQHLSSSSTAMPDERVDKMMKMLQCRAYVWISIIDMPPTTTIVILIYFGTSLLQPRECNL
jgi:hypothetical protein